MLKIYLVSVLPVQPLSFNFSTSAFQFQHLPIFCFSPSAPHFFFFFLFQRFSAFFFSGSAPPFFLFQRLPFFFSLAHVLSFFFQPKTIFLFSPKPFSVQPKTFLFCCFTSLYLSKSSFSSNLK